MTERSHTVRIDSGDRTHLVVCTVCPYTSGPFVLKALANAARANHTAEHYREREAARVRELRA